MLPVPASIIVAAPGRVNTVVDPRFFAVSSGEAHLRGIARDPFSGDIYVGSWAPLARGETPWFGPYVEDAQSIRRIEGLPEVSAAQYITSPHATTSDERTVQRVMEIGSVGCSSGSPEPPPGATLDGILVFDPPTGTTTILMHGVNFASGVQTNVHFSDPIGIASDPNSGSLFLAEACLNRIREIDANGHARVLVGNGTLGFADGTAATASFRKPESLVYCAREQVLYVADTGNNAIRTVHPDGTVTTFAGQPKPGFVDGAPRIARFNRPTGVACDDDGNVYVADSGNNAVRRVTVDGAVSTVAGNGALGSVDGSGTNARFATPGDITYDPVAHALYVVDWSTNTVRKIALSSSTSP